MKQLIKLGITIVPLLAISHASSTPNVHPEILAFCQRTYRKASTSNGNSTYASYCNAHLYPERYNSEIPSPLPASPGTDLPEAEKICAAFGNSNSVQSNHQILCSLSSSDPTRPKNNHYQGDAKNNYVLELYARDARGVPSYLHSTMIDRMRIAAQHQERSYFDPSSPSYSPHLSQGSSHCWIVQGGRFVRTRKSVDNGLPPADFRNNNGRILSSTARRCLEIGGVLDAIWD